MASETWEWYSCNFKLIAIFEMLEELHSSSNFSVARGKQSRFGNLDPIQTFSIQLFGWHGKGQRSENWKICTTVIALASQDLSMGWRSQKSHTKVATIVPGQRSNKANNIELKSTWIERSEWVSGGLTPCRQLRPSSRRGIERKQSCATQFYESVSYLGWHCDKVKGHTELKIEKLRIKTQLRIPQITPNSCANVHLYQIFRNNVKVTERACGVTQN